MSDRTTVAIVVFDDFELLDVFGPAELFGMPAQRFSVRLIAESPGPVKSAQGPRVIAESSMTDAADAQLVVVPGGMGTRTQVENSRMLEGLRSLDETAAYVTSVCTGAALLARAGLLDGHRATSNKAALDWVRSQGPAVTWVERARWVEDGRYWTSSGVSAGMDMSLALIRHLAGEELARNVSRFAEYHWNEDSAEDPFAGQQWPGN